MVLEFNLEIHQVWSKEFLGDLFTLRYYSIAICIMANISFDGNNRAEVV